MWGEQEAAARIFHVHFGMQRFIDGDDGAVGDLIFPGFYYYYYYF